MRRMVEANRLSPTIPRAPSRKRGLAQLVLGLGIIFTMMAGIMSLGEELQVKPPWLGSSAGQSDELLPPWTPVVVDDHAVHVWGRVYRFSDLPFPCQIISASQEMLAGPISLCGASAGQSLHWKGTQMSILENSPMRARLHIQATADTLECNATVHIEYDGMLRCDFQLHPTRPKVALEKLDLEIPFRPERAKYLHFWPGRWGSVFNSQAIPPDGYQISFKPFFWIGDEERGLAWFAESDRNFWNVDPNRVIEVRPGKNSTVLTIHLVGEPHQLAAPLEYTFGFQATPVKPMQPDAWDYRICHMGNYGIEENPPGILDRLAEYGVKTICFHEHWTDIQNYPRTTHGEKLRKLVKACHERGIQLLLYHGYEMSTLAPEWEQYHEECLVYPRAGGYKRKPEQTAYIVCYRSHWQDFLCDGIAKLMEEYDIDGVYLDGTSEPWGCRNQRHGCGYVKPDGSVGTTYPIFAVRQTMRRIYTIVKKHNPNGQVNVHQSTCMVIPTLAFATSYWDGEHLQSIKRPEFPGEVLPLDAFRAEFMGRNWGVPAELLWYPSGPFQRREAEGLALLHDVPVRPNRMENVAVSARIWRAFDELGRHEAEWIPYWESPRFVRCHPDSVKVSLYNRPGRGLIVVAFNLSPQEARARLTINLSALEQTEALTAQEVVSGAPVPWAGNTLELTLAGLDYAMLRFHPR